MVVVAWKVVGVMVGRVVLTGYPERTAVMHNTCWVGETLHGDQIRLVSITHPGGSDAEKGFVEAMPSPVLVVSRPASQR